MWYHKLIIITSWPSNFLITLSVEAVVWKKDIKMAGGANEKEHTTNNGGQIATQKKYR
jgi:hypothetical protein